MPDKKEVEKESMEEKTPNKILQTNSVEEEQPVGNEDMEQLSSLDVLWQHAFGEIDEWAKHAEFRDEVFLKEAKHFAESIKRNQGNVKDIAERFNKEFAEWERTAREEFLMSTTSLQHFFPIRSYEDINAQIDQIQKKTMSILSAPCQTLNNYLTMERYLEMIDQYIALRKKGRMQYIKTVKQAGNIIYESQRGFVNLFARQIKSVIFPLNKYLEKTEELSKS
ncbi:hypothetical protein QFZ87_004037 [Bacillus sp. SLBN-46]|jgi:hypothetical protein|uniref:hypothetical protein n=1 Tax=Bacillus sp. SLBN-46 TaxID=3042283 RepID=UPI002854AF86|nr:hypothetical protein [Bacillus sp. SLBN-46]MDR6124440.1 hypothetical protein [Bacillus sp. SLBN-46]